MTTQYVVDVPNTDSSKPWIVIKSFDTRDQAVAFTKRIWGAEDGHLCLISQQASGICSLDGSISSPQDGDEWVVDVPNPNFTSTNNKFLNVEGFHHEADALDFAIENYQANKEGYVSLISKV